MSNIVVKFNEGNKTLYISGEGDISWKDTIDYAEMTEHVIIEGNGIYSSNFSNIFTRFTELIDIEGIIDTSMAQDMSYAYAKCFKLIKPIQGLDTTSGEQFDFFHSNNKSLETVKFNSTMNGFKFKDMFHGCESLTQIEGISIPSNISVEEVSNIKLVQELLTKSTNSFLY